MIFEIEKLFIFIFNSVMLFLLFDCFQFLINKVLSKSSIKDRTVLINFEGD